MEKGKKYKLVKGVLLLLMPFIFFKLILMTWGEDYQQIHGIVEYRYNTGTGTKYYSKAYCNIKLVGCDTIFGYYKKYGGSYRKEMLAASNIQKGDSVCIYFRKGVFCDYQVIPDNPARPHPYEMHKQKIENSTIIDIAGINRNGKLILDPKERKYYDPFYYWFIRLLEGISVLLASVLIIGIIIVFAGKFLKRAQEDSKKYR